MEEFKDQLEIYIPLTANCIMKLENDLNSIDNKIKICKERIEAKKKLLIRNDRIKEFFSKNFPIYQQQLSTTLSSAFGLISEINFKFEKFEFEIQDYKRSNFILIKQKIDDWIKMNNRSTDCILPLEENIKDAFKEFEKENSENLSKKHEFNSNIPSVENVLNEQKECYTKLNEQYLYLSSFANYKSKIVDIAEYQLLGNQQIYKGHQQKNELFKKKIENENIKLIKLKCQVRKSIFVYLNKIKRLNSLTEEKNSKLETFRTLIKKYNRESIAELNEKKLNIKAKIDRLDETINLDNNSDSYNLNSNSNDLIKQLEDENLVESLNSLDVLYDKLISKLDDEIRDKIDALDKDSFIKNYH